MDRKKARVRQRGVTRQVPKKRKIRVGAVVLWCCLVGVSALLMYVLFVDSYPERVDNEITINTGNDKEFWIDFPDEVYLEAVSSQKFSLENADGLILFSRESDNQYRWLHDLHYETKPRMVEPGPWRVASGQRINLHITSEDVGEFRMKEVAPPLLKVYAVICLLVFFGLFIGMWQDGSLRLRD